MLLRRTSIERTENHRLGEPRSLCEHLLYGLPQRLLRNDQPNGEVCELFSVALLEEVREHGVAVELFIWRTFRDIDQEFHEVNGNDGLPGARVALDDDRRVCLVLEIFKELL